MPTDEPEAGRTMARRYRVAVAVVCGALAVAAATIGAASALQGPRLRAVAADPAALTSAATPQVTLTADQTLTGAADVHVEPAVAFDTSVDGARLIIRFAEPLDYAVPYRITADVSGAQTGHAGHLETTVTTPDAEIYLLHRTANASDGDSLLRVTLHDPGGAQQAYAAEHILGYGATAQQLVVLSSDGTTDALETVAADGTRRQVPIEPGLHSHLHVSDLGQIGWMQETGPRADGSSYSDNLFVTDPAGGAAHEVRGFAGAPLTVVDWRFVPGTTSVVVQDVDQHVFVIDTQKTTDPTLLGRFGALEGYLPGSVDLVMATGGTDKTVVDLSTGAQRTVTPPSATLPTGAYPATVTLRSADSALIAWSTYGGGTTGYLRSSTVVLVDAAGQHPVVGPTLDGSWTDGSCVSPNGRYASVQVIGADGHLLGRTVPGVFSHSETRFVDLATGAVVQAVPDARDIDWCG